MEWLMKKEIKMLYRKKEIKMLYRRNTIAMPATLQQRNFQKQFVTALFNKGNDCGCFSSEEKGCDASVLLDAVNGIESEKEAPPNQSLKGFDMIQSEIELACPATVSCSDILVLATRDVVGLAGGPFYPFLTGRGDSSLSFPKVASFELPALQDDLTKTLLSFSSRGFAERETFSLLGRGHSIRVIHCRFFGNLLYNYAGRGTADPSLEVGCIHLMRTTCNNIGSSSSLIQDPTLEELGMVMDYGGTSETSFGTYYHQSLVQGRGILHADQQLMTYEGTANWVRAYASHATLFRKQRNNKENGNIPDDTENMNDMKLDKEEAYADPTGIQLDDKIQGSEEYMNIEESEVFDTREEVNPEESTKHSENTENGRNDENGKTSAMEEDTEVESAELGDNGETDDTGMDHDDSAEKDLMGAGTPTFEQATSDFTSDPVPIANSATRPNGAAQASEASTVAPEVQWSNCNNMQNGLAPSRGLPSSNVPEMEISVPDSDEDGKLTSDVPKFVSEQPDTSSTQRTQPNPYRSVGDALEKWKERVKVSVDSQENKTEASDDMEDENADEYGFVSEFENGTSQALGLATSDQMAQNIKGEKPEGGEDKTKEKEIIPEMKVENQDSQTLPAKNHSASTHRQNVDERNPNSDITNEPVVGGTERSDDGPHICQSPGSCTPLRSEENRCYGCYFGKQH